MHPEEPISETRAEMTTELHHVMHYTNDLIERAAYAGLTVDVMTLKNVRCWWDDTATELCCAAGRGTNKPTRGRRTRLSR